MFHPPRPPQPPPPSFPILPPPFAPIIHPPAIPPPFVPIPQSDVNMPSSCEELAIPIGTITLPDNQTLTITNTGIYFVNCDNTTQPHPHDGLLINPGHIQPPPPPGIIGDADSFYRLRAPFYGSVIPVIYTLSGATVLAWLLLVLLVTSSKKRPWLQKFSTLALAALFTATLADAVKELNRQYRQGYQDAFELQRVILNSMAFEIPGVIVQCIMWLAHIQIVLRIFVRRREVLLVKIVGAILWIFEIIFWSLGLFTGRNHIRVLTRINRWALTAYAFEIVLVTTYAVSLLIYSFRKRKYAYNSKTYIIALFSIASLIAPLVFLGLFSSTWLIGWAVYCALVSNGAATVVLWDWLDAIEHLEKQEQRSGVMGRQVYEDEMALDFKLRRTQTGEDGEEDGEDIGGGGAAGEINLNKPANRFKVPFRIPNIKSPLRDFTWSTWDHIFRAGSSPASLWTNYNSTRRMQSSSVDIGEIGGEDGKERDKGNNHVHGDGNNNVESNITNSNNHHGNGDDNDDHHNSHDDFINHTSIPPATPQLTTIISRKNRMQRFVHPVKQQTGVRVTPLTNDDYQDIDFSSSENDDDSDDDDLYIVVDRNDEDPSRYLNPPMTITSSPSHENDNEHNHDQPQPYNPDLDLDLYDQPDQPNEEPPNVFNRVPGFDPGDYWDDKAPSSSH